ncbi:hypothetical protein B296_00044859 [Ensete ventricosum]|uniref:Uncharacterized protein n=1 Tax=Ensete ventricosum TaxID=4639 RepID=A0A426Z9E1_ENSVE|nr:hypothetical protein B296_00044859 [Ensete ventricosum]
MRTVHYRAVPPNGEVSASLSLEIDRRQSSSGQYRPLLGGTADWGGFHLITTQNWSVTVDFNCHRSLSGGNGQFWPSAVDFGWYQKKREKRKREKKRENLESGLFEGILDIPITWLKGRATGEVLV